MAAETPTHEPEKLIAGKTWKWEKTLSDYPASEWSLKYYLRLNGQTITEYATTADGDTHVLTMIPTFTALRSAGVHDMRQSLITLTLLFVCTGCQTAVEYNNTKRLTEHPQFPKAAFHAPDFTRETLRTIAELEWELERRPQ